MVLEPSEWRPDPLLEQELLEQFDRAVSSYRANPNLIGEHANHEDSIRVGGYANRTLLELVQNAADAMAGTEQDLGRVEIVLDPETRTLYCANSGRPFSKSGLIAITHAHLSAKRGDEIGRFGLGFKSVLAVSKSPQVLSRSVSFEFNSDAAHEAILSIGTPVRRLPVLRTPTLLDANELMQEDKVLQELADWATTIIRLPDVSEVERLQNDMERFSSEFLLFVSAVREIRLRVLGADGMETVHTSRDLGGGRFRIETPDGNGDEWIVGERMHAPSAEARRQVGEAVSRDELKVSVAIPARYTRLRTGRFWSYFPLHDETSASGLFNAPWSVNDDRTTLLRNDYNREILATLAEIFVDLLPQVATPDDPGAILDYLPARGREAIYFGDEVLCALVPRIAVTRRLIPDATCTLRQPSELRPLDFEWDIPERVHEAWCSSPHTGEDVPHSRCYSSHQRFARLRQLFAVSVEPDSFADEGRDMKRSLEKVQVRGILSWLREWAEGPDVFSAINAFEYVTSPGVPGDLTKAKVIPTNQGLRSIADRNLVFLSQVDDIAIEGAAFVDATFLSHRGIEETLRKLGFRPLDPVAILHARVARLTEARHSNTDELQVKFWEAVNDVSQKDAIDTLRSNQTAPILVPTQDGGWAFPQQVIDLDEGLASAHGSILLDRERCSPAVARELGVVHHPVRNFSVEDELFMSDYRAWVLADINSRLTRGDRPVDKISLFPTVDYTPGPFSALLLLEEAGAPEHVRQEWTYRLLAFGDAPWDCEDKSTGANYRVISPVRWAVERSGLVKTSRGFRRPQDTVAPVLIQYRDLLPLFDGPREVAEALALPKEIEDIPAAILRDALAVDLLPPSMSDSILVDFIIQAARIAYPGGQPPRIPARVGRIIESRPTRTVYISVTDEQQEYLAKNQRPQLSASEEQVESLINDVGCLRFEDSFSFSIRTEGEREPERLLDVFTGLRGEPSASYLANASIARAVAIAKWVTTEEGVETHSLDWHLEGVSLTVRDALDDHQVLSFVSEAFHLGLTNTDINRVLRVGLDNRLESMRQEALAAPNDALRLDAYFGEDDLREKLPKGLWQGLEAQGLVSDSTSVSELCLSVYGKDTIAQLSDLFEREGFPNVPRQWAGGSSTISWLRSMGFGPEYAGQRAQRQEAEFIVPGAVVLPKLHDYQEKISKELREVLTEASADGRRAKAMVELPTGAGKTRVATQSILQAFIDGDLHGHVLWIAQSQELCEQAVQTFSEVWRGLGDTRPLSISRHWEGHPAHPSDTEFSVVVATDAQLEVSMADPSYKWLRDASAVFIDEGHVAGDSPRYTRILTWLGVDGRNFERPLVGLSATPFKGTSAQATDALAARFGRRKLRPFEEGENAYAELVSRGVLARVRHQELEGVEVRLSEEEQSEAERTRRLNQSVLDRVAENHARMGILVDSILGLEERWAKSVLVFTPNVLSAQVLAATLRFRGVNAASVSGQTGRQERRDVIQRFKKGEIQVLANCDLLTQGFDAPGVSALYIARPTFSPNAYIQMAGRGLRGPMNGGKEECLIVDMADNFGSAGINSLLGFREYEDLWREQQT